MYQIYIWVKFKSDQLPVSDDQQPVNSEIKSN